MKKVPQKKLYILVLFLAIALAFSGCGRKSEPTEQNSGYNENTTTTIDTIQNNAKADTCTFKLIGKDNNDWNIYKSMCYGFEIKYPAYLNVLGEKNTSITNVQGDPPTFFPEDGNIWIDINNIENNAINVFDKIGQVEENYSVKLGNTIEHYYNAEFLNFDAVMSDLEYSNGELILNPGIFKTLYFKNNKTTTVNVISAHIPNKNKKQIELFNEILKTIKLID